MAPDEPYIEANGVFTLDKEEGYAGVHDIARRGQRTSADGSCGESAREREEARTSTLAFFKFQSVRQDSTSCVVIVAS